MSVYNFSAKDILGEDQGLDQYAGKVLLIVNTASKCGFTPQLEDLQKLYSQYQAQGLEILGFPCNQFMQQEPGTSEEIAQFCSLNYGVEFPIFEKVEVNGHDTHPLFEYLKDSTPFEGFDLSNASDKLLHAMLQDKYPEFTVGNAVRWNFTKFLIDQNGKPIKRFESSVSPLDMEPFIQQLLSAN